MDEKTRQKVVNFFNREDVKKYINEDNWNTFFEEASKTFDTYKIYNVTEILLEAKINFWVYMDYIPSGCFYGIKMDSFIITNNIKFIGERAFAGCSYLEDLKIENGIEKIFPNTFAWCRSLVDLTFPNSLTEIHSQCFESCDHLERVDLSKTQLKHLSEYTFSKCHKLREVRLPKSLNGIGSNVFVGCTSLKDIYYEGTKKEWNAINKITSWRNGGFDSNNRSRGKLIFTVHCSDGDKIER